MELLQISAPQRQELNEIYALIPSTRCLRKTHCCLMLPETTLIEALAAIDRLLNMSSHMRKRLIKRGVCYFFLNPVEITSCPFLEGRDCIIYQNRFFGCRAYGLWSEDYYSKLVSNSRDAKKYIQKQWENLGISLPQEVIDFQVPYCKYVESENALIDDETLLNISNRIEKLSQHFSQWHQSFRQRYFSDMSFLLVSLMFGVTEAVRMKFTIVRDIVTTGNRSSLDRILEELNEFELV